MNREKNKKKGQFYSRQVLKNGLPELSEALVDGTEQRMVVRRVTIHYYVGYNMGASGRIHLYNVVVNR